MTTIIIGFIVCLMLYVFYDITNKKGKQKEPTNPSIEEPTTTHVPEKLMDLETTTVTDRQRVYNRGYRKQLQFDELQRRAEAVGDTATLEAIRLGTYAGPLPELKDNLPNFAQPKTQGNPDAPVQRLEHFCVKDKGYHVSVWPKDYSQFDIVEFTIAGLTYRENIGDYIGEFQGNLEAEPNNPYDADAIKVLASDGHHVGYVPKDAISEVKKYFTLPCTCFGYIGCNNGTYFSDCYIPINWQNVSPPNNNKSTNPR